MCYIGQFIHRLDRNNRIYVASQCESKYPTLYNRTEVITQACILRIWIFQNYISWHIVMLKLRAVTQERSYMPLDVFLMSYVVQYTHVLFKNPYWTTQHILFAKAVHMRVACLKRSPCLHFRPQFPTWLVSPLSDLFPLLYQVAKHKTET
jgi:hypothetical protein